MESGERELSGRTEKPCKVDWRSLHRAVLSGDPGATQMVAEHFLEYVWRTLKKEFPGADDEIIVDATTDAFMDYFAHPERFDPERKSLPAYLVMLARGDLLNALEKKRNRERREFLTTDGELPAGDRNDLMEGEFVDDIVYEVTSRLDPGDARAVELMAHGVKSYEEYAKIWDIDLSNRDEMRRQVKRKKMQLQRKLTKLLQGYDARKGNFGG